MLKDLDEILELQCVFVSALKELLDSSRVSFKVAHNLLVTKDCYDSWNKGLKTNWEDRREYRSTVKREEFVDNVSCD